MNGIGPSEVVAAVAGETWREGKGGGTREAKEREGGFRARTVGGRAGKRPVGGSAARCQRRRAARPKIGAHLKKNVMPLQ